MKIENKTILITGASGVIGYHFLLGLQSHSASVYAVHNRPLPNHLKLLNGIKFLQGDLTNIEFLRSLPCADIIIHGATFSSPRLFSKDPIKTLKLNTTTVFGLLDKLNGGGRFLYISSSEIYSGITDRPFKEEDIGTTTPIHPRSCYIEGKRCGETICLSSGKDVKIARVSLVYGDGVRSEDDRLLYDFINQSLIYGGITIKSNADNLRTYCFVPDATAMMWNILLNGRSVIYNIGGMNTITIGQLAKTIALKTNGFCISSDKVNADGAPTYVSVDMGRYNGEFGEYDYTSLEEGLDRTINWQRHY
jgi:nucleoside-diphosphate-sugar epimerase